MFQLFSRRGINVWTVLLFVVTTWMITITQQQGVVVMADHAPSCTNYTKNGFGPETIREQSTCRTPCETAEGLPIGDFNEILEGPTAEYQCDCKSNNNQDESSRTLCYDHVSATTTTTTTSLTSIMIATLMLYIILVMV